MSQMPIYSGMSPANWPVIRPDHHHAYAINPANWLAQLRRHTGGVATPRQTHRLLNRRYAQSGSLASTSEATVGRWLRPLRMTSDRERCRVYGLDPLEAEMAYELLGGEKCEALLPERLAYHQMSEQVIWALSRVLPRLMTGGADKDTIVQEIVNGDCGDHARRTYESDGTLGNWLADVFGDTVASSDGLSQPALTYRDRALFLAEEQFKNYDRWAETSPRFTPTALEVAEQYRELIDQMRSHRRDLRQFMHFENLADAVVATNVISKRKIAEEIERLNEHSSIQRMLDYYSDPDTPAFAAKVAPVLEKLLDYHLRQASRCQDFASGFNARTAKEDSMGHRNLFSDMVHAAL